MSLVLGIDTCGPVGSVALARFGSGAVELLGQVELPSRNYAATLVSAVGELLAAAQATIAQLQAIAVTSGPGSFTGVRVGLAAVKGLAEPAQTPVVAVSRLAVLAAKAGIASAALDAHRHELFLRVETHDAQSRELLAGAAELAELTPGPARIAVCDDAAAGLIHEHWTAAEIVHVPAPTATDLLSFAVPLVRTGQFVDLVLLDGHYLRRSDAEIFGPQPHTA